MTSDLFCISRHILFLLINLSIFNLLAGCLSHLPLILSKPLPCFNSYSLAISYHHAISNKENPPFKALFKHFII